MGKPRNKSVYLERQRSYYFGRKEKAEQLFDSRPELHKQKRFITAYNEIVAREEFVSLAKKVLHTACKTSTNSSKALSLCEKLYISSISPSKLVYPTEEDQALCIEEIKNLQERCPEWDDDIVNYYKEIEHTTERNMSYSSYIKAIVRYVEVIVRYYLWVRDAIMPIPGPNMPPVTGKAVKPVTPITVVVEAKNVGDTKKEL